MMDLTIDQPIDALRLLCGAFFLPHAAAKIFAKPVTLGFFQAAGYQPAEAVMYFALVVEIAVALGLVLGIQVELFAWLGAAFMTVAGLSVLKVSRGKWLWNLGGGEYCFFWALACGILALSR